MSISDEEFMTEIHPAAENVDSGKAPADPTDFLAFVSSITNATSGSEFRKLCEQLPTSNAKTGRSLLYNRVLKMMIRHKLLPPDQNRYSCLTKKEKDNFFTGLETIHRDPVVFSNIKDAALFGFPKLASTHTATADISDLKLMCNSSTGSLNRISLLAHLLIEPRGHEIICQILGVPEGEKGDPVPSTKDPAEIKRLYRALNAMADETKTKCANTFDTSVISEEAYEAIKEMDPSKGNFKTAEELQNYVERAIYLHDILITVLDRDFANGMSAEDRRRVCYESLICMKGRPKNLGLYYCFLVWENTSMKFLSVSDAPCVKMNLAATQMEEAGGVEDLAPAEQEAVSIGTIGTIGSTRKVGRPKKVKGKGRAAAAAAALTAQSEMAAHFEVAAAVEDVPVFEPPATRASRRFAKNIEGIPAPEPIGKRRRMAAAATGYASPATTSAALSFSALARGASSSSSTAAAVVASSGGSAKKRGGVGAASQASFASMDIGGDDADCDQESAAGGGGSASMDSYYQEKTRTEISQRLLKVMESAVFSTLPKDKQQKIRAELLATLGV